MSRIKLELISGKKGDKTQEYIVYNKRNEPLGNIYYYKKWKHYVWEQAIDVIMSVDCLQSVVSQLKSLAQNNQAEVSDEN